MNAAVGLMDGLGLDGDRCIRVIPRQDLHCVKSWDKFVGNGNDSKNCVLANIFLIVVFGVNVIFHDISFLSDNIWRTTLNRGYHLHAVHSEDVFYCSLTEDGSKRTYLGLLYYSRRRGSGRCTEFPH